MLLVGLVLRPKKSPDKVFTLLLYHKIVCKALHSGGEADPPGSLLPPSIFRPQFTHLPLPRQFCREFTHLPKSSQVGPFWISFFPSSQAIYCTFVQKFNNGTIFLREIRRCIVIIWSQFVILYDWVNFDPKRRLTIRHKKGPN